MDDIYILFLRNFLIDLKELGIIFRQFDKEKILYIVYEIKLYPFFHTYFKLSLKKYMYFF